MRYSAKQCELLALFKKRMLKRINILVGSVRSGKTWISLVLWAFWILSMPKDGAYLLVAKTLTSLKRNCLDILETLVGKSNFSYSIANKEGVLFGRRIYLEGVNDARAESKIRGMTLNGAYCDELTLFTEDFFTMLLSRLSEHGAKLFGTTNPDNPNHWVKVNYIDRQDELDMLVMKFLIDDNTFLDPEYVKQLKKEYVGVYYERYILGYWRLAEGAIYRVFSDNKAAYFTDKPDYDFIHVGVDFGGNKSAHTFVATGHKYDKSKITALMSARLPAADVTPEALYKKLAEFVEQVKRKYGPIKTMYCDSAEQTLINGIRDRFPMSVQNARKNPIQDRIKCALSLMAQGRFFYTEDCATLVNALTDAVYDEKKFDDQRLDDGTTDIDTLDSWEYSFERYLYQYAKDLNLKGRDNK